MIAELLSGVKMATWDVFRQAVDETAPDASVIQSTVKVIKKACVLSQEGVWLHRPCGGFQQCWSGGSAGPAIPPGWDPAGERNGAFADCAETGATPGIPIGHSHASAAHVAWRVTSEVL